MMIRLINIRWDTEADGEIQKVDLPTEMTVEADGLEAAISAASDITGWCIISCEVAE